LFRLQRDLWKALYCSTIVLTSNGGLSGIYNKKGMAISSIRSGVKSEYSTFENMYVAMYS